MHDSLWNIDTLKCWLAVLYYEHIVGVWLSNVWCKMSLKKKQKRHDSIFEKEVTIFSDDD